MKKVLNLYKPIGSTPLETVQNFQKKNHTYKNIKISYAGRLDPMAEGVLLVLVGDELKKQEKYWNLDKEYETDMLFGIGTDSYDVLGIPELSKEDGKAQFDKTWLCQVLSNFEGEYTFPLPPFSSHKIKGKPLFWWARNNKLAEIKIPQKTIKIYKIKVLKFYKITKEEVLGNVLKKINLVNGDFRQKEIIKAWKNIIKDAPKELTVVKIKVKCSSGTYIRAIANEAGKELHTTALLFNLKRTSIGKYKINNSTK